MVAVNQPPTPASAPVSPTPPPSAPKEGLLRQFSAKGEKTNWREVLLPAGIILGIIFLGALTGYLLAGRRIGGPTMSQKIEEGVEIVQGPKEVGIKDERVFRDTTSGRLVVNDNEAITEGSHKLLRPGGESKTAYVSSSVLDLNQFLGKCVQIWGETFAAQQVAWLMDVGRVKILDQCPEGL